MTATPPWWLLTQGLWAMTFVVAGLVAQLGSELYRSARGDRPESWMRYVGVAHVAGAIDRVTVDSLFRAARMPDPLPESADPVIVGIDQAFLDRTQLPLSLSQHALGQLLATIGEQRPSVIVVDLVLPDRRYSGRVEIKGVEGGAVEIALARGLTQAGAASRIVLARMWDPQTQRLRDILPELSAMADPRSLAEGRHRTENVLGSAMHCPDDDGVTRAYPTAWCQPVPILTMSELAAGQTAVPGLIDFRRGDPFPYRSATAVLDARAEALLGLRGRPVVLGAVLPYEDRIVAPVDLAAWPQSTAGEPGVLLQAQMLRTLLHGGTIPAVSPMVAALLMVIIALSMLVPSWRWASAGVAAAFALAGAAAFVVFRGGTWIPMGGVTLVAFLAFVQPAARHAMVAANEKRWLLRVFGGYVSPRVMKQIVAGGRRVLEEPAKKEVSILFVDIRDFTPLCESLPPNIVVSVLADYRDAFVDAVHDAGGTVSSFTGDGLMAIFGAPDDLPNHAQSAVDAGIDMLLRVRRLAEAAKARGEKGLRIGVGVNCGLVLVGLLKASSRHEYGALGDAVNVAARLESLSKEVGYPLVVSNDVFVRLGSMPDSRDFGMRGIKGHHPVHIHGIGTRAKSRDGQEQPPLGKAGVVLQD